MIKCLAMLGESCGFLTALGNDAFGVKFVKHARKQKIQGLFSYSPLPTSCVLCLITPDGQRTMRFYEGSNLSMTKELIRPEYFRGIKLLHIDSYSLRRSGLVEKAMQLAKQQQALISLDLSSFEIVQEKSGVLGQLLEKYVDIVFGNADETLALTGLLPQEGCFELQKLCKVAVVMIGKEGCIVGHKNQLMLIPAYPANVVDTTGAGDFFAGGFLHGYLHNKTLIECAELGNRWGSAIVQVIGAELPS